MRHLTRLTLILGAAIAMLFGTSIQAQAAYSYTYVDPFDYSWDDSQSTPGGSCALVGVQAYGDLFFVQDLCSDGRGVQVQWRYTGGSTQESWHYTGGYTGFGKAAKYNREIAENRYVEFRVGLSNNGSHVSGTWSDWEEFYNG